MSHITPTARTFARYGKAKRAAVQLAATWGATWAVVRLRSGAFGACALHAALYSGRPVVQTFRVDMDGTLREGVAK